jgi:Cu/Ag efflux protein CusF
MKAPLRPLLALIALAGAALAFAAGPVDGEVRKVDAAQQKITLKHGEIKALDMPAMTMSYRVKDAAALGQLAPGDRVRFSVEKIEGAYTVTSIQKAN